MARLEQLHICLGNLASLPDVPLNMLTKERQCELRVKGIMIVNITTTTKSLELFAYSLSNFLCQHLRACLVAMGLDSIPMWWKGKWTNSPDSRNWLEQIPGYPTENKNMEDYSSILLLKSTCLLGLDSIRFIGYGKFRRAQEYLASCVLCQQSIKCGRQNARANFVCPNAIRYAVNWPYFDSILLVN